MSATAQTREHGWHWRPGLIAVLASGSIMALELVVGRIAATYVGWSLYTWTAIISIVMLGISLGSWLGGRLADRWSSPRLLAVLLIVGGLLSWSVLLVDIIDAVAQVEKLAQANLSYVAGLAALGIGLAFLPCLALGCISPVVVRLTMRDVQEAGSTVGRIHALETVGSIVATFATGFWLISQFGTRPVVWGIGCLLLLMGAVIGGAGAGGPSPSAWRCWRAAPASPCSAAGSVAPARSRATITASRWATRPARGIPSRC